jgi:hypothetical protein
MSTAVGRDGRKVLKALYSWGSRQSVSHQVDTDIDVARAQQLMRGHTSTIIKAVIRAHTITNAPMSARAARLTAADTMVAAGGG